MMSCRTAEAMALASSANSPVLRPQVSNRTIRHASNSSKSLKCSLHIKPSKKSLRYQVPSSLFTRTGNRQFSLRCSLNFPNENPFDGLSKVKTKVKTVVEHYAGELWQILPEPVKEFRWKKALWQTFPEPVKEFPWKKAEEVLLQRLFFVCQRALELVLIASSLSDVIFAISRNQELLIPVGLFLGCLMSDFMKETSQELFPITQEEGLSRHFIGIGLSFVFIKFVSLCLGIKGRAFLSHLGNGGLMQVWWLRKKLAEGTTASDQTEEPCSLPEAISDI